MRYDLQVLLENKYKLNRKNEVPVHTNLAMADAKHLSEQILYGD